MYDLKVYLFSELTVKSKKKQEKKLFFSNFYLKISVQGLLNMRFECGNTNQGITEWYKMGGKPTLNTEKWLFKLHS